MLDRVVVLQRKSQVCTRCKTLMYPNERGHPDNHKRDYCSDGAPSSTKHNIPFPQPDGIFVKGKEFNIELFLLAVQDLYGRAVIDKDTRENFSLCLDAFGQMLFQRGTIQDDGVIAFKLFDGLGIPDSVDDFVYALNGSKFLRILCLSHST